MNTLSSRFPRQRGMALISVLAVLLLLTLLVVAFMSRTTAARAASSSYHATASTRLLADTAVNLVQAQINEATTLGIGDDGSATETWGSQPGAIRVFQADGTLDSIYRLYSATPADPTTTRKTSNLADLANDLPADTNWTGDTAQWVDLNAYVQDSAGKYHFPIVDPRDPGADPTANPSSVATLWQPTSGDLPLKGFSINPTGAVVTDTNPAPMPVRWLYILKDGSIVSPDAPANPSNQLTFNSAVNYEGNADIPNVQNPIVGRIAFWTDDETSKININTAAGDDVVRAPNQYAADSIFWDAPFCSAPDEAYLAMYQPFNGEIQRYPGHPGTVGLNSTLSALLGLATDLPYNDFYGSTPDANGNQVTPGLLPRYAGGGSISGTVPAPINGGVAAQIYLTANRLYPSVAEMLFRVDPGAPAPGQQRPVSALVSDTNATAATAAVERANFFLTAHSASSELNLFGEPRVSVWPYTTTYQTPTDNLLAFDSTIARTNGGTNVKFYFQRTDPTSSVTDCNIPENVDLFHYLDQLTSRPIPGFGASFTADKYPNPAMHQILGEIFDYIRTINVLDPVLIAQGGSPSHSYGQNWGNVNASVIANGGRSGCGGVQVVPSANNGAGIPVWGTQGVASFPVPIEVTFDFVAMGKGKTDPYTPAHYPGSNEAPIPYEQYSYNPIYLAHDDTIVDETLANGATPAVFTPIQNDPYVHGLPAKGTTAMQAFVYVSFVNPSAITSAMQPMFCYSISGLTCKAGGVQLYFPGTTANPAANGTAVGQEQKMVVDNSDGHGFLNGWIGNWLFGYIPFDGSTGNNNGGNNPGMLGPSNDTWSITNVIKTTQGNVNGRYFPFYSQLFCLQGQQGWTSTQGNTANPTNIFLFSGCTLTIRMYDAHGDGPLSSAKVVDTYTVTFPPGDMMLPTFSTNDSQIVGTLGNNNADPSPSVDRWHCGVGQGNIYYKTHISTNDTVQSMVLSPAWSDARLLSVVSSQGNPVPDSAFVQHPNYAASSMAHDLLVDAANPFFGNSDSSKWGRLVQNINYSPAVSAPGSQNEILNWTYPIVPPELNGAFTTTGAPGDWDSGVAAQNDGPWVNMADEGALVTVTQQGGTMNNVAYFSTGNTGQKTGITSTFSPNRQIPSPAMFGSLPTGVSLKNPKPWQTLLFRPGSGAGGFGKFHPGEKDQPSEGDPADYLLLDLFWMPQAEPYPISQPFVTEGKINLNYEIQPFTYITRDTALRALLGSEKIAVLSDKLASAYKVTNSAIGLTSGQIANATGNEDQNGNTRLPIDVDQTLGLNPDPTVDPHKPTAGMTTADTAQTNVSNTIQTAWYDSVGHTTHFFRSESEICGMFLVPQGYDWQEFSGASMSTHSWYKIPGGDFALVGDNLRERPYVDIYSRVTTKSNTYTVYYTVQSLKNAEPQTDAAQATWDETKGAITGEYRGSTTLERYLDPNEKMPDFFGGGAATSLEPYYKWRVVATRQFAP